MESYKVTLSMSFIVVADDNDQALEKARKEYKEILSKLKVYDFDFQVEENIH